MSWRARVLAIVANRLLPPLAGRVDCQRHFQRLHALSLECMNIGGGAEVALSGEGRAVAFVADALKDRRAPVVFDVGANVGVYGQTILSAFDGRCSLHCFEPSPATFRELEHNITADDSTRLHQLALSDREGTSTLYSFGDNNALSSLHDRRLDHFGLASNAPVNVRTTTIDAFCTSQGIEQIDLLKLDVEGHELSVLEGARRMLSEGRIHFIQFEFGGCNIDSRTYLQDFFYLLTPTHELHRIIRHGLAPIPAYDERLEVFITTNFLAVPKATTLARERELLAQSA